eukprot:363658-Chlamydomonas_euryale.AAC.10
MPPPPVLRSEREPSTSAAPSRSIASLRGSMTSDSTGRDTPLPEALPLPKKHPTAQPQKMNRMLKSASWPLLSSPHHHTAASAVQAPPK